MPRGGRHCLQSRSSVLCKRERRMSPMRRLKPMQNMRAGSIAKRKRRQRRKKNMKRRRTACRSWMKKSKRQKRYSCRKTMHIGKRRANCGITVFVRQRRIIGICSGSIFAHIRICQACKRLMRKTQRSCKKRTHILQGLKNSAPIRKQRCGPRLR